MEFFSVFHPTAYGWAHSNIGPRRFLRLEAAIAHATRVERGAFQVRAIDEAGRQVVVHEGRN